MWWIIEQLHKIKAFFQRLFRGYADEDIDDAEIWIAKRIAKAAKILSTSTTIKPPANIESEEWIYILKIIQHGFESFITLKMGTFNIDVDSSDFKKCADALEAKKFELRQEYEIGLDMFLRYYENMWKDK
jgi:hypothetical protein